MKARPAKAPPIPAHPGLDVRSDEVVWDGRFPLQRVRFTYTRFDGAPSAELTWELWRRGGGVAVLPYDPAADAVALIQQFRLPALAAGLDPVMTECAAGLLERGEDPEAAARRELAEETGLRAGRMERIGRYMLMQGGCDEVMFY
jgi:ADP-ribose pyrophosphatase